MPHLKTLVGVLVLTGCASGPRPLPAKATPAEQLEVTEEALLTAKNLTATFDVEATGQHQGKLTGSLTLAGGNKVVLSVDGTFDGKAVHVDFDSRGDFANRAVTRGASASANSDPIGPALGEAVVVGLVRMGLMHNLATLVGDQAPDHGEGGAKDWVKVKDAHADGSDAPQGEHCERTAFTLLVEGRPSGQGSLCISSATSLPLLRTQTVDFASGGTMEVTERFTWKQGP
jgi:hypothetical protein